MELADLTLALIDTAKLLNMLIVAIGLGLVIFFHELGHFLVAKWCGVYVERFSIGFGQPILCRKWGETEYALGWLPFGGYVKMLGQDDMDPAQMTDEEVSANPRSYTAKNVPQRMAIISAGVIMNIITGLMFFALAFGWGIETTDRVVGSIQVGMPAWKRGIHPGDTITGINGRPVNEFNDLLRGTTLSRGPINVTGFHHNGDTFALTIEPKIEGIRRMIGVGPSASLNVIAPPPDDPHFPPALPGTAASRAGFHYEDTIVAVNGDKVGTYHELLSRLDDLKDQSVRVLVARRQPDGSRQETTVDLPAETFVGLGLQMGMGKIFAVQDNSPAARSGLQVGDRIAKVNDLDVEKALDPFRLTEAFSAHAGEPVTVTVVREVPGGSPETLTIQVVPNDRDPWSEPPVYPESPLSVPSIGIAYHLVPTVFSVSENGPASQQGIGPRDVITRVELIRAPAAEKDALDDHFVLEVGDKNWAHAFWTLQEHARTRIVKLTVKSANSGAERHVELNPVAVADWYLPSARGLNFDVLRAERKADSFAHALNMGGRYTLNSMEDIYLTLRGLFTRDISYKGLSGPIGIAKIAYSFASVGLAHFVLFLGLISINLAVINFLPIPVLDGGHMVFLLWEGISRRKPSEKVVAGATYAGLAFVLGLMLFVIYLDLFVSKQ